jgi:hypothetical protein
VKPFRRRKSVAGPGRWVVLGDLAWRSGGGQRRQSVRLDRQSGHNVWPDPVANLSLLARNRFMRPFFKDWHSFCTAMVDPA